MKYLIIIFFVSFVSQLDAQDNKPLRIEVNYRNFEEVYSLPLDNEYLVLLEHKSKSSSKGETWILELFDKNFKKKNTANLTVARDFIPHSHKTIGDSILWICFAEQDGKRASFLLYKYNLQTGLLWHTFVKGNRKSRLINFEIIDNKIILIGERLNEINEQLDAVTLPNGMKIISPYLPKNTSIIAGKALKSNNMVSIIANIRKGDDKGLYYYQFSKNDSSFQAKKLEGLPKINILDGSFIESKDGDILLMGTYNHNFGRQPNKDELVAEGTYFAKLTDSSFDFFKTNKFSDFNNVYSILTIREQKKIKSKKDKGKEINISFKLLMHQECIKQDDQYIIVAETYHPEYHYENNFDSRGYMYQQEVFDGYRTSNCIIAAFDSIGNLSWDNYMNISEIREYTLQENILVFAEADSSIIMAYYYNGDIISKTVKGNRIVFKKSQDRIETTINENVISEEFGHIEKWYDNFFILSGYQVVFGKGGNKRKVFFFNLINFE